jgi:hypothetical protein
MQRGQARKGLADLLAGTTQQRAGGSRAFSDALSRLAQIEKQGRTAASLGAFENMFRR